MIHKAKLTIILTIVAGAVTLGASGAAEALSKKKIQRICWKKVTQSLVCDLGNDITYEGVACQNRARSLYKSCVRHYSYYNRPPSFIK